MDKDNILIKVENSSLARDIRSKAVINTNDKERELYLARKKALTTKDLRIQLLEQRVQKLEELVEKLIQK